MSKKDTRLFSAGSVELIISVMVGLVAVLAAANGLPLDIEQRTLTVWLFGFVSFWISMLFFKIGDVC